jgi:hypothetical protein
LGRLSFSPVLVGVMLVTGVALAQQGLIVEPWRKGAVPAVAPLRPTLMRSMPSSGLVPAGVAPEGPRKTNPKPVPVGPSLKWSPPVVALLVDPWVQGAAAAPVARPARQARPRWVPTSAHGLDIVDPWADVAPKVAPLVASRPVDPPRSTIF